MKIPKLLFIFFAAWAVLGMPEASAETFRIEIDYMVAGDHSHQPTQAEIDAVVQMFACQGHTLIVEVDDQITHYNALRLDPDGDQGFFQYNDVVDSYGRIKQNNFDHAADGNWHYCLFAHQYEVWDNLGRIVTSGSSGLAEIGGDDFIVTLGAFTGQTGSAFDKASTLAHEFGHNLGLGHCGTGVCGNDDTPANYVGPRPLNLASVMSYFYQLRGVRHNLVCQGLVPPDGALFKNIDYSHGRMCSLDESALNETLGTLMRQVDWNCDGSLDVSVGQDLNGTSVNFCAGTGQQSMLHDYNEWGHIQSPFARAPMEMLTEDHPEVDVVSCITAEEWEEISRRVDCGQPVLQTEACVTADMHYVRHSSLAITNGSCTLPFDAVRDAHAVVQTGSVLFVEPGTFTEGPQVLNRRMRLYSAGRAVIR